jgi:WD40 repeat protein
MPEKRNLRKRGVVLTPHGQIKLQQARREKEIAENFADRFTLEAISDRTGLSIKTITKVLEAKVPVDKPTLETFFHGFGLLLEIDDYQLPSQTDQSNQSNQTLENFDNDELARSDSQERLSLSKSQNFPEVDFGESPDVSMFYGRQQELQQLMQWLGLAPKTYLEKTYLEKRESAKRLIGIFGMGGMGKTSLVTKLLHEVVPQQQNSSEPFLYIIWRSLRNAPSFDTILGNWLDILSAHQEIQPNLPKLLAYLQRERCLLVLDNFETILDGGIVGVYRQGYEAYGEMLRLIGETPHRSTLIITSREKASEFNLLEGEDLPVCSLTINGSDQASLGLLQSKGIKGTSEESKILGDRYGNSPLAVKIIAATIRDLFDGEIALFLKEDAILFSGIRRLLDQQFARLSALEQAIMFWLAINREWTDIDTICTDLLPKVSRSKVLEAIASLYWRNLIEKSFENNSGLYTQQPMLMEYVTERFTEQASSELLDRQDLTILHHYAFLKTTVKEHIRCSQSRLILEPIVRQLQARLGAAEAIAQHLKSILHQIRPQNPTANHQPLASYAAGNLLNLLCHLKQDLTGCNFAGLAVWHAYAPNVPMPHTSFAYADLQHTQLTETFGAVFAVAYSPDGKLFATGELSGYLRLWRLTDGQLVWAVRGSLSWIRTVAFAPDGQTLAIGTGEHSIAFFEVATGRALQTLCGHTDQIHAIAFHPHHPILASACGDHSIRLWDIQKSECLHLLSGHTDQVQNVCWNYAGDLLLSCSSDRTVRIWQLDSQWQEVPKLIQTITQSTHGGHSDQVFGVAFHPERNIFASGSADNTVKIWQLSPSLSPSQDQANSSHLSIQLLHTLKGHTAHILFVQFSPDGEMLATSSSDTTIRLWDTATGKLCKTLTSHANWVRAVQFSPDGRTLLSGCSDYTIRLWDWRSGLVLRTWMGYSNWIWGAKFSKDGQMIACGGGDCTVRLWDVATGKCVRSLEGHSTWILGIAFDRDRDLVATGSGDNSVRLWQASTGKQLKVLNAHKSQVLAVQFSPTEPILASSSSDYTIRLWQVPEGNLLRVLEGHQDWIRSIGFSHDGMWLASAGQDATVKLWNVATGACIHTFSDFETWVWGVVFHPHGKQLAIASAHIITIWNLTSKQCIKTYIAQSKWIRSIDISNDGKWLIAGDQDRLIHLWNLQTDQLVRTLTGHSDQVLSVQVSADSRYIISGSADETTKIWDLKTGQCLQTFKAAGIYEGMDLTGVKGLTPEAIAMLQSLGALKS